MRKWKTLGVSSAVLLAGSSLVSVGVIAGAAEPAAAVTVSAEYGTDAGALDKDLILRASQGGYLTLQNLHVLADHADELADLGLRELRVDHVFDDDFYGVVTDVDSFDFTQLDAVLKPLVDNEIRPWISLSYMPGKLGPSLFSPPNDYAAWGRAVEAMVSHYAAMGAGYTGWNWEVWNEPDDKAGFWAGTTEQYNTLYGVSAAAVRAADPTAKVGGPGVASTGISLFGPWMDYIAANPDVPCDFVSWHSYGPNDFATTAQVAGELSRRGIPAKQLYVTEWNTTPNMANGPGTWPDTHQTASYALQRMYEAIEEPGLSGVHFFSGLEGWTPTKDYNGDLGLLTVDGRRKAVGNAFAMVDAMGGTRLTTTVGGTSDTTAYGLVTADPAAKKVSVLLWNNREAATEFQPSVAKLPFGDTNVAITRSDVDSVAGNSYADAAAGLVAQRPMPHERLAPSSRTVVGPTGAWSDTITLGPNASTLIELAPTSEGVGDKPLPPVETTVNVARGATVSTSSSYTDAARGWSPGAVVDGRRYSYPAANEGNPTMGWTSVDHAGAAATEYVQVDFGAREEFDTVTLWPRDDQAADGRSFPADFTITGSDDGTTWSAPLYEGTDHGGGAPVSGPQTFEVAKSTYRYLRITATELGLPVTEGSGPRYRFQLAELEVTHQATVRTGGR
jgi:glycosyl hydrolase family 39 (putative alpha-L-iduronidase)/F5/8 type C domain-containing protein